MKSFISAVALALLTTSAGAETGALPTVDTITLDNGLTIMLREDHSVPLVSVELRSRAGSLLDPQGKSGLAELTATLLTYGTAERSEDDISQALALLGGSLSAGAGSESFAVYGSVPTIDAAALDQWLAIFIDVVRNPAFPEAAVERVKRRRVGQIAGLVDNRSALAGRAIRKAIFGDHPYGRSAAGTLASVAAITRQDLVNFHHTFVVPDDAVLGIAGDFDRDRVLKVLTNAFGDAAWGETCDSSGRCVRTCVRAGVFCGRYRRSGTTPVDNPYPTLKGIQTKGARIVLMDVNDPTLNQAQIRLGSALELTFSSPQWMAYSLGTQVLGGDFNARLNQALRVRSGLTYGARWTIQPDDVAPGAAMAYTYTNPKSVVRALGMILSEIDKFREAAPSEAELDRVKSRLINGFVFRFETPEKVLGQYMDLWQEQLPKDRLKTYRGRVKATSPADIHAVRNQFPAGDWVAVVVANKTLLPELEAFAKTVGAKVEVVTPEWVGVAQ